MPNWTEVCDINDIHPNTGVCAQIDQKQIAIFRVNNTDEVYAIGNYDPIGKANVLSRGIMAQLGEHLTVASPLYKQHFDLKTGTCLEEDEKVPAYNTKVEASKVFVHITH